MGTELIDPMVTQSWASVIAMSCPANERGVVPAQQRPAHWQQTLHVVAEKSSQCGEDRHSTNRKLEKMNV